MPEYHQIETYTTIKQDAKNYLAVYKEFLHESGWLNSEIEEWLNRCVWSNSNDSFEYPGLSPKIEVGLLSKSINIQFMFLRWTPEIIKNLPHNCLRFDIVFETQLIDDLSRNPEIRYTKNAQKIIWDVMNQASKFFPEYGIFFTDEAQDGVAWASLVDKESAKSKLWQFECAIISNETKEDFHLPNQDFFSKDTGNQLWLARKFVWDKPLWEV